MGEREPPATLEEALLRIGDLERRLAQRARAHKRADEDEAAAAYLNGLRAGEAQLARLSAERDRYEATLARFACWAARLLQAGLVRDEIGWIRPGADERELWRDMAGLWRMRRDDESLHWETEERAARAWLGVADG